MIDPTTATVRKEEWDGKDLGVLYKWMRCDVVERVLTPLGVLWVDEEGLLKRTARWVHEGLYDRPIHGVGVLVLQPKWVPAADELLQAYQGGAVKWGLLFNPHAPAGGSA